MIRQLKRIASTIFLLLTLAIISFGFTAPDCKSLKNGTFHFYPKEGYHTIVVRKGSQQTEINTKTKDTSYWHVTWTSDCEFTTLFISSTKKLSQQEIDFYKQSSLKFSIAKQTKSYYVYDATITFTSFSNKSSDTMWLHARP